MPLVVNGMKIINKKARHIEFVGLKNIVAEISMSLRERLPVSLSLSLALGLTFLRWRRLSTLHGCNDEL